MKKRFSLMLFGSLALASTLASAQAWPTSVVGLYWVVGNQSSGPLNISSQGTTGLCRSITGSIYGGDTIQGFYCPFSGRIQFVRKTAANNDTFQVWTGSMSIVGTVQYIGGTFSSINPGVGGPLGEYNFQASK